MKKILVVGSGGMLGQELVKTFKKDPTCEIFAWDKKEIDIASKREVASKISKLSPNVIINAAAYNAVDKCEEDKKEFALAKKVNGLAPGYLAETAKKIKAVLVHFSTDYVFNGEPEIPEPSGCTHVCSSCSLHDGFIPEIGFDEDAKPDPINKYGETKFLGEKNIQKNTKRFYIIRISRLFGKPALSEETKKSFFSSMLEAGKKSPKKGMKVVDDETSCFTYAKDLAEKTKEIIDSKQPFGIYHVTNSDPCTWYESVLELYKQAKIKTRVLPVTAEDFPRPAKRPFYSVLLNTKLNPMRSYKEALKDFLKV